MRNVKKIPALFIEGGDSVGKNELVRSLAKYFLYKTPSDTIILMNFPQFWFFGHDIRLVIRGACDDLLAQAGGVKNAYIRAALYGIDRNIATLLVDSYLQENKNVRILSDRGPYSSAVTTGYLWAQNQVTDVEVGTDIVPAMFYEADDGMFSYFDVNTVLCGIEGEFTLGNRKALDNYEAQLPQQYSYDVYHMLDIPEVITRTKSGWRSRKEIVFDTLALSGHEKLIDSLVPDAIFSDESALLDALRENRIHLIGPRTLVDFFQVRIVPEGSLNTQIRAWEELSLLSQTTSGDRKEVLDELETFIAIELKRLVPTFNYSRIPPNSIAKHAIVKLLRKYPVILEVIERTSGAAMKNFLLALSGDEQLRLL